MNTFFYTLQPPFYKGGLFFAAGLFYDLPRYYKISVVYISHIPQDIFGKLPN